MSKYIIEIEDEPFVRRSALYGEKSMYRAKGFKSLVFDQFGLDKLTPLDKELEEAYQMGKHDAEQDLAKAAYDEAYQKGVHDGSLDVKQRVGGAYQKGYDEAKLIYQNPNAESDYQRGLDEAWEAITKIAKMPDGERMTHFGEVWISNILNAYSLEQIFTILEKSESEPDEIKVGDEVENVGDCGLVTWAFGDSAYVMWKDGSVSKRDASELTKTGRHFTQIEEVIKAMEGGAE